MAWNSSGYDLLGFPEKLLRYFQVNISLDGLNAKLSTFSVVKYPGYSLCNAADRPVQCDLGITSLPVSLQERHVMSFAAITIHEIARVNYAPGGR